MGKRNVADVIYLLQKKGVLDKHDKLVGFINGAIVLEYPRTSGYGYGIVDPITLKKHHILTRKKKLEQYDLLEEKAKKWGTFEEGLPMLEKSYIERKQFLLEQLFLEVLPKYGMVHRREQEELAAAMLEALEKQRLLMCEAGVGTGKTHAYILATIIKNLFEDCKKSTIIATSTIALQNAIIEEYLPQISEMLMKERLLEQELRAVVRKGKRHYLCERKLRGYLRALQNHSKYDSLIIILEELMNNHRILDLDKLTLSPYVKERICVTSCERDCSRKEYCRYQLFLYQCKNQFYDFQIVNHNYLMADVMVRKRHNTQLLTRYGSVIIDEAHQLPSVMKDVYGVKVSSEEIPNVVKLLSQIVGNVLKEVKLLLMKNDEIFQPYLKGYGVRSDKLLTQVEYREMPREQIEQLQSSLRNLCNHKQLLQSNRRREVCYVVNQLEELAFRLVAFQSPREHILWVEMKSDGEVILCALAKRFQERMKEDLWNGKIPIILTSGTISIEGDFSYFKRNIGLLMEKESIMEISTSSPFDYKRQGLLYFPKGLSRSGEPSLQREEVLLQEMKRLIEATYGHTLILFTSYAFMKRAFENIRNEQLKFPMYCMEQGQLNALEEFKQSNNGVLFASDSAGEGIDLAGDLVSSVIIVRLPFPIPTELSEHRLQQYHNFEEYLNHEIIPNMLIKLRQWVGRGIRRETDTCVFSILDERASRRYYKRIREALPPMGVTREIKDVEEFIKMKKGECYFERTSR